MCVCISQKSLGFLESFDKRKIVFKCGFVFFFNQKHIFFVSFSTTRQDVVKVSQFKNLLLFISHDDQKVAPIILISKKFLHKFCQIEDFAVANGTVHRYEVIEIVRCGNATFTGRHDARIRRWWFHPRSVWLFHMPSV